jgi:chromosomal replication initiator protein
VRSGYALTEVQEVVMEDSQIVAALSRELAQRIGTERFALWLGPQTKLRIDGTHLVVRAPNAFVRDCLRKHLAQAIGACWKQVGGGDGMVEFEVDEAPGEVAPGSDSCAPSVKEPEYARGVAKPRAAGDRDESDGVGRARDGATLAAFVVGPSNEYAFRAAELTARGRQQASPVLLCGPTGVGKTHLLRAIAREYRRHHPRAAAVYLSAEQFTTSFIEAIRGSGLPSFRQKCRGSRLLLIDDVQFFVGKQRTLEELQHTIDTLIADGRRLVLASDRSLAELRGLGPELTSRLSGGLVCEMEPPEFVTRLEIARQASEEMGMSLDNEVLRAVASQISAGAREIRGALHRLQATSEAYEKPITRDLAEKALADLARHITPAVRLGDVQKAVCEVFGLEPAQLRSERKGRALSEPRMLAMWLARKYTRAAWSEIGQYFGRRSHSTVISAHRRVERLISTQAEISLNDRTCRMEDAIRRVESALRTA